MTNEGIGGPTLIFFNATGSHCNSAASIMAACPLQALVAPHNNSLANGSAVHPAFTSGKLDIYPNPARHEVNILFDQIPHAANLKVMDLLGRVVYEKEMEEGENKLIIDLNNHSFENGIYVVNLILNSEIRTRQFIVQR